MASIDHDANRKTVRLYFEDSYLMEFSAKIVASSSREGRPVLVLDRTCFYPESGGQPWDTGTLNGVPVVKVIEDGEAILHIFDTDFDPALQAGASVAGRIDWPRRFDHMQQHTGQHILSQVFIEVLNGETKSFHLGSEFSTLEIGLSKVEEGDLDKLERRVNEVIQQNKEVKTYFVAPEKVGEVPFRRPPKKEGVLRVVEIEGFDYSACGGTHCRRTGEVGFIKITRWERIRGNMRFEFLCGGRAVADTIWKSRMMRHMAGQLNLQEKDLAEAMDRLAQEGKSLHKNLKALQSKLVEFEARDMAGRAAGPVIQDILKDRAPEEAKLLALSLIKHGRFVVLFGASGPERDHLIMARSDELAIDLREVGQAVASLVEGKGGGGPSLVEIVTDRRGRLETALEHAVQRIRERL